MRYTRAGGVLMLVTGMCLIAQAQAFGGDLAFSDPSRVSPPAAGAIGFPDRSPGLDVLPGFQSPPPGYGEVAFFWWLGDPLTKERLTWELDRLAGMGVMGLQINYAHSDHGGRSYGLTYPSDPPLFSPAWWDLVGWFIKEARRRGMAVSLSDYTLGVGQGWRVDELLRDRPDLTGAVLRAETREVAGGATLDWALPAGTVVVSAHRLERGAIVPGPAVDLRLATASGMLRWQAPAGKWRVVAVRAERVEPSLDPTHPDSGHEYARRFFGSFEQHNPGEAGRGLNFFFSDELDFRLRGDLWSPRLADEFRRRKGYELLPELAALFQDTGPRTPKVRLDYRDVMVALSEEGFFKPVFDWHQQRGMIFGCDHGGRGRDVTEFGDYFRTQRWNQGPGCDQPGLGRDLIKNKVASSIAHLYNRPRVWLEGYYGSGWGTSSADIADATFANFIQGQNLLTFHGLYYSTHGGWWEWAPPCNHFRFPYYPDMKGFMTCVQRLSYLLCQGRHRCDVAIVYPVAAVEAGMDGNEAVRTAFDTARSLYLRGVDFDFIDFESLERAQVEGGELRVSGEAYRVLVLPAMKAVRHSTMEKARALVRGGGMVAALGCVPEASDRAGRDDPELEGLVKEVFGVSTRPTPVNKPIDYGIVPSVTRQTNAAGGLGMMTPGLPPIVAEMTRRFPRDFAPSGQGEAPSVMHRKVGPRDVFAIYQGAKGRECTFRATGRVELWDPWSGRTSPLPVVARSAATTTLRLPLTEKQIQLIVFSPGDAGPAVAQTAAPEPQRVALDGPWSFELEPTLENRFGDFRWPPTAGRIGPEVRQFQQGAVTVSFGPQFWKLGPLPEGAGDALESRLAALTEVDPQSPIEQGGRALRWEPVAFSWRWGIENDPGHQGYHGLKEEVHDEFLALGRMQTTGTGTTYEPERGGTRYYLWTTVPGQAAARDVRTRSGGLKPAAAWWRGRRLDALDAVVRLEPGANPVLLRYDQPGRGSFVVDTNTKRPEVAPAKPGSLAMRWYGDPSILPFELTPQHGRHRGSLAFRAAPGLRSLIVTAHGTLAVAEVSGKTVPIQTIERRNGGTTVYRVDLPAPAAGPVPILLTLDEEPGHHGGAALAEPIIEDCGPGTIALGDWSEIDGLRSYSGGAWYRKTFSLTPEQAAGPIRLDLGNVVASAEVRANGKLAGIMVAPPFVADLSGLVQAGENRVEIRVRNTLANHYTTIPTRYRGALTSGLLGPVALEVGASSRP